MHVYFDRDECPHQFDLAGCEIHDLFGRLHPHIHWSSRPLVLIARTPWGALLLPKVIGLGPGYQPGNPGTLEDALLRDVFRLRWTELSLAQTIDMFDDFGLDYPPSLVKDIEAAGPLPKGDQASINPTPARRKILEALSGSSTRLTKSRLFAELKRVEPNYSEHTLRNELPKMIKAGWLDHDLKARPPGYGLTPMGKSVLKTPNS
jgi:hypothetical protein